MNNEDIEIERVSQLMLNHHAEQIAKHCGAVAHWGDGDCGYIIDRVLFHLKQSGLYKGPLPGWRR